MTEEIRPPIEGLSTIGAQFTKSAVVKILQAVRKLKDKGWPEPQILEKMRKELPFFHPHTLRRLYDKSVGNAVEDDIRGEDVAAERKIKERTIEIDLRKAPAGIEQDCLVQFRGTDWYVAKVRGLTYTLKDLG